MHNGNKQILLYIAVALLTVVLAGLLIGDWREPPQTDPETGKTVEEMMEADATEPPAPVYMNGDWYQKRLNVETYLFLGVDTTQDADSNESYNGGGQSDVIFLLVLDWDRKQYEMIQLDRDTMTAVDVLGVTGNIVGTHTVQLGAAYGYGDGSEQSCENTVRAVSNLLYGIEIDGYVSLKMDAIAVLNDLVGGVTVTIEDDFSATDSSLMLGQTVRLTGEQAVHFIRSRMRVGDGSNISRMRRHRQYLSGMMDQLEACFQENASFVNDCYSALKPYMITDLSSAAMSTLGQELRSCEYLGSFALEGVSKQGEVYMEFYADDDGIQKLILDRYYQILPET